MDVEVLRAELYNYIDNYGTLDIRTVKKSQELDKLIELEQQGLRKGRGENERQ